MHHHDPVFLAQLVNERHDRLRRQAGASRLRRDVRVPRFRARSR